jgi:hypothetical protein
MIVNENKVSIYRLITIPEFGYPLNLPIFMISTVNNFYYVKN